MTKTKEPKSLLERWDRVVIKGKAHGMPQLPECILLIDDRLLFECPSGNKARVPMYILPHLEKWVREDVAVWAPFYIKLWYSHSTQDWHWSITKPVDLVVVKAGFGDEPTEAHIACAEALVECLGGLQ